MATKVNVIIQGAYAMPPVCVSCGAPAGTERISFGGSDWSGKHFAYLKFPICPACDEARRATKPKRWGRLLGGIAGFVVGVAIGSAGSAVVESGWWALVGISTTILGIVLGGRYFVRRVSDELKERAHALPRAVTFKKYRAKTFGTSSATIEFVNDSFASMFCAANPIVAMPADGPFPSVDLEADVVTEDQVAPAGWFQDPSGRHERRWWDGSSWTEHVEDEGAPSTDVPDVSI